MSKSKKKKQTKDWFSKLTEAEREIWKLVYYHPTFIRNRAFALELLFCIIGTGIKWNKEGQIVDTVENNYLTANKQAIHNLDEDIYKKAYTNTFWKSDSMCDSLRAEDIKRLREYNFSENCIAEYTLKNIETAVTISIPPKSFYPLGSCVNLMEVPKNIQPDWLELAIETCDLIIATDPTYRGSDNRLRNKNNIRLAKKQKTKLLKIKQKRAS